ncbi:MAG: Gfo/Idh/MocA family oxidoreductase [Chloroflexi bacterium]|nr:Gfo/Idh/MocA family oxidoreductase [Chloroflexota bacterium]
MSTRKRCLMLGAGGMAEAWIRRILPAFSDRLEIIGLVDISPTALAASGDFLGLEDRRRFLMLEAAFDAVAADFCIVVIPAAFHSRAAALAAQHGVPILCEKPLADTWTACSEIYRAVSAAGVKMQVVQNYRYRAPMLAMKAVLELGELGRINYVVARFADDCREYDTWKRRHELPHAMLMDGAAHHLDMLRNLTGADCAEVAAMEWNPPWSTSTGEFCALSMLRMTNDARAMYEGNATAAGEQNAWREEAYRAECEFGSVRVGADQVVRTHRHTRRGGLETREHVAEQLTYEAHAWIVDEFLNWLDGGPTPATTLDDNIRTAATIFGAIEAAHTRHTVDVQAMVARLRD